VKLDVLAIAAHPDDIELACSGTMLKLVRQGKRTGILDLTQGELGTRGTPAIRATEAAESSKILGLTARENLKLPDGNIQVNEENRLKVIQIIRHYTPDILLIPHFLERHPDHESAHRLAREAWFYAGLEKIPSTYKGSTQEPFRPRSYYHYMQTYEFTPSFIVDISDVYDDRMKAALSFRSQFFDARSDERETFLSSPEFLEMLRARFEYFGDRIGVKYGEPFFSVNMVGVRDLFNLTP
jgi:bacillithiol biosynthesis deacetylase BshB1